MSDIYVFSSSEEDNDYSTMGLVGALTPEEATFKETLNGDSIVELKHPLDEFGAYRNLVEGNILVVPVPVRTTPEIQNGSCVTTVWTYKVKPLSQLTHKNQRTIWKKSSGGKALRVLGEGEIVTVVWKYDPDDESNKIKRWKVKSDYGTGWINVNTPEDGPDGFELVTEHKIADNSQAIEEIQSPWSITPQYFRIYEVKKSMDAYEVSARHISYDLLYNMTTYESSDSVTLQTALDGVLNNCFAEHEFKAYTNVTNEQAGLRYMRKNPMDAFLNSDDGLCTLYDVCLVRDNYSLYFLHDPGVNRGVRIQYGKNMTGVSFESSTDEIATRIVPVGENKNGTDLWLSDNQNERYVDSPKINKYPVPHVYELECENCKVGDSDEGGGKVTVAIARARMKAQAEKLISDGCDEPEITMEVEFVNLGDTVEYAQFKNLENCFLADYVIVQHPDLDIDITARISEIEWDCMLDRMNSVTIGQVGKTLANTGITSWQIPSGISGSKIASGSLGNAALKSDIISDIHMQAGSINANALQANIISAVHMQSDSINTDALQAGSVTANKIAANSIATTHIQSEAVTAGKIAAGAVTADTIEAGAVTAGKIAADAIEANNIKNGTITSDKVVAGFISVGSNLVADGAIGETQIADTSITNAKIVSLNGDKIEANTIKANKLLITGDDGVVYEINATSSGLSKTELTDEKYKDKLCGSVIVAESITGKQIAANSITSNLIAANAVTAAQIDVASLFASDTFTTNLYTSNIHGEKSIKIMIDQADQAAADARSVANNASTVATQANTNAASAVDAVNGSVASVATQYYASTSATSPTGGSWQNTAPEWSEGIYIWTKTATTTKAGNTTYSDPVCITGNTGAKGTDGTNGKDGKDGTNGTNGKDGVSPTITTSKSGSTTTVSITDASGTKTATIKDGDKGDQGEKGTDGTSPTVTTSKSGSTTTVTITDVTGTKTATIKDGDKGDKGDTGAAGADGTTLTSVEYAVSSSNTTAPSSWQSTVPSTTTANKYLWTKNTYSDGKSSYSVSSTMDSIEVGSRNFLLGSATLDMSRGDINDVKTYAGSSVVANKYGTLSAHATTQAWSSFGFYMSNVLNRSGAKLGDVMTMSVMCMATFTPSKAMPFHLYHIGLDSSPPGVYIAQGTVTANEWFKVAITFTVTQAVLDNTRTDSYFGTDYYVNSDYTFNDGGTFYFAAPKIEFGNVATDWTPAPEDVDNGISNAQTTADGAVTEIETIKTDTLQYIEVRTDGTHLKAMGTENEMVLTNEGLHVDIGSVPRSRFAATYVQFNNYQLRRTADGGLAFKLSEVSS